MIYFQGKWKGLKSDDKDDDIEEIPPRWAANRKDAMFFLIQTPEL
jgi:hypothetical protein